MEQWKKNTLECLKDLADADLQEREWGRDERSRLPGPGELLCQSIDDTAMSDAVEVGGIDEYPEALVPLLRRFIQAAVEVDVNRSPMTVVRSPGWKTVQVLAADVLTALKMEWGVK